MVDNHIKVCFFGKRSHWRQPVLSGALSRGTSLPEGIEQHDIKLTRTEHQLAHQYGEFMMSLVYVCKRTNAVATEFRGN